MLHGSPSSFILIKFQFPVLPYLRQRTPIRNKLKTLRPYILFALVGYSNGPMQVGRVGRFYFFLFSTAVLFMVVDVTVV